MKSIVVRFTAVSLLALAGNQVSAADLASRNQMIVGEFQSALKGKLGAAMQAGGPVNAIDVCAVEAPQIASQLSRQYGVKLQRVSTRYRNPLNMPSAEQRTIIEYLQSNPYGAESYYRERDDGSSLYAQRIGVQGVCLTCHGSSLSEPVRQALAASYPGDMATGYQVGDFRGIFSVESRAAELPGAGILNFRQLSDQLLVGGQPSPTQLDALQRAGVGTIINLRTAEEMEFDEASLIRESGMDYAEIPVAGGAGVSWENSAALRALINKSTGPVFVHCSSGNRAAALLALDANRSGLDQAAALSLGRAAGLTRLEARVQELLEQE